MMALGEQVDGIDGRLLQSRAEYLSVEQRADPRNVLRSMEVEVNLAKRQRVHRNESSSTKCELGSYGVGAVGSTSPSRFSSPHSSGLISRANPSRLSSTSSAERGPNTTDATAGWKLGKRRAACGSPTPNRLQIASILRTRSRIGSG